MLNPLMTQELQKCVPYALQGTRSRRIINTNAKLSSSPLRSVVQRTEVLETPFTHANRRTLF